MPLSQPFIDAVLAGDGRAVARAISLVEDETPEAAALIGQIYPRTGRAYLIGITGAPGTGKSTLVDALTVDIRRSGLTVGIIAVDPTSPFTGGAILGDRVRMTGHAADAGVYIRSMATRGHLGGLSRATGDVALVLDAAGKDVIIIETVGVGQDEVDIVRTADVSIVVVVPGTGDDVQAIKAGIMEIGDIFVVNKADREGADQAVQAIAANLSLQTSAVGEWKPPIVKTEATRAVGVDELWRQITRFREHSAEQQASRRRERQRVRLRELLARQLVQRLESALPAGDIDRITERVAKREIDPYAAVAELIDRVDHESHP
ncbi:MAG TPA: methylmalonyl Co-A mutase-associated GTPase MeaB [Vicinamibacterales bacterium]|nr:methylmalonyl Co-A mutase-associated GTPase MeaB [Vicinamibacterales bacterium]